MAVAELVVTELPAPPDVAEGAAAATDTETGKVPFDSALWQVNATGDFVNTKTGEVRGEEQFLYDDPQAETAGTDEWDGSQDSGGDDWGGSQVRPAKGKK